MKKIKILSIFLMLIIAFSGCKKDDFTGYSTLVPTNPTISVDFGTVPTYIDGVKYNHKVTLTMSETQIVDVQVHVNLLEGATATEGEDFSFPHTVMIPAGATEVTFEVSLLPDEVFEPTETFTIQVGDELTANASITPVTQEFSIQNFSDTDLAIELSWMPEAYDQHGEAIDYYDIADMILLIYDGTGTLVTSVDGAESEGYVLQGTDPDDTYTIAAAFFAAMEFDDAVDINFHLDLDQPGIFTDALDFAELASTADAACPVEFYLVEVAKSGTTYTVTENAVVFDPYVLDLNDFVGTVTGVDDADGTWYGPATQSYTSAVNGTDLEISGFFMTQINAWGTMTSGGTALVTLNADGTVVVPRQFYASNDEGDPNGDWIYHLDGSGTWSHCGDVYWIDIWYDPMPEDPSDPGVITSMWDGGPDAVHFDHAYIEFSAKKGLSVTFDSKPVNLTKEKGKVKY